MASRDEGQAAKIKREEGDIIEISSDENAPSSSQGTSSSRIVSSGRAARLAMQNKRLQRRLNACIAQRERLVQSFEEMTQCHFCHSMFVDPYVLSCGHTFCFFCINSYFRETLCSFQRDNPTYDINPPHLQACYRTIRDPNISEDEREETWDNIERIKEQLLSLYDDHPTYGCPSCALVVDECPITVQVVTDLVSTLRNHQNAPPVDHMDAREMEESWDDLFFARRPFLDDTVTDVDDTDN
ncbi:hypothetical protein K474DRAFT_1773919 [Panus rudis PR-1116 ss-1]|nr:hypothetical protein K474DRAFT_1773919 [Panus rudis PR-1116 ss-1]